VIARALERGLPSWVPTGALELAWSRLQRLERELNAPLGVKVVTVGGATLGGSGKTPLALAISRRAAMNGARVALLSRAYAAGDHAARWVDGADDPAVAGDEAVACAAALASTGARVVSGVDRQACVSLACAWASLLVIDGVAQLAPRRADWSLLAVDHEAPWGSGACPPRGDLRAPREALLTAADTVVRIRTDGATPKEAEASWRITGARRTRTAEFLSLDELRATRFTLVTNVARPERITRALAVHGLVPARHVELMDHSRRTPLDLKEFFCLAPTKVRQARNWPKSAWIEGSLELSADLCRAIDRLSIADDSATTGGVS